MRFAEKSRHFAEKSGMNTESARIIKAPYFIKSCDGLRRDKGRIKRRDGLRRDKRRIKRRDGLRRDNRRIKSRDGLRRIIGITTISDITGIITASDISDISDIRCMIQRIVSMGIAATC